MPGIDLVLLTGFPTMLAHAASAGGHLVRPARDTTELATTSIATPTYILVAFTASAT